MDSFPDTTITTGHIQMSSVPVLLWSFISMDVSIGSPPHPAKATLWPCLVCLHEPKSRHGFQLRTPTIFPSFSYSTFSPATYSTITRHPTLRILNSLQCFGHTMIRAFAVCCRGVDFCIHCGCILLILDSARGFVWMYNCLGFLFSYRDCRAY